MACPLEDNKRIHECLDTALDLLTSWIRSSAFPTPEIQRVAMLSEYGDQTIRFEVPAITLTQDELEIFDGKIDHTPLGGRALLIRGNLSAIAGRLKVVSSKAKGTVFEIFVPAVDPIAEFALADRICRKLVSFDFTLKEFFLICKWTWKKTKEIKRKRLDGAALAPTFGITLSSENVEGIGVKIEK
ncbi:MAG: hypothetical protein KCHDKBKB_01566 [Elusimicrobia bacterium]|nr:hypothetical protein [Elusimicrobiota bacterium]